MKYIKYIILIFFLNTNFSYSKNETKTSLADVIEPLLSSVVNISTYLENTNYDQQFLENFIIEESKENSKKKSSSIGSGFIISSDGYIATNYHVVEEATEINVSLDDKSKFKAKLIAFDKKSDIAILKISVNKNLIPIKFGDSDKSRVGDDVIVIGNPFNLGSSVSTGIISAKSRILNNQQESDFIQTDASINKGNSGGPMFNLNGEVIGINTAIYSTNGANMGLGFANPSNYVAKIIKQLREQGEVNRGWIGISVQNITEEMMQLLKLKIDNGVYVTEVTIGSPAYKSGVQGGDVITKLDNIEINDMKILPKIIMQIPINKIINLTIIRDNKIKNIKVKVAKL